MSYQDYPSYPDEYVETAYVEVIPAQRSMGTGLLPRSTSSKMGKVVKDALVVGTHDQCAALLTKAGLEHTAALSVMEAQFSSMTPRAAARYREIVDAYSKKVADKIRRW